MSAAAKSAVYLSKRAESVKSPKQSISSGLGLGDYSFRVSGLINLKNGNTQKDFLEAQTRKNKYVYSM